MSFSDAIADFRDGFDRWLSVLLKLVVIGVVVLGGLWIGLSVYGNAIESKGITEPPSVIKAQYQFIVAATGNCFLTDEYEELRPNADGSQIFTLKGYYYMEDKKWVHTKNELTLDEFYFGKILMGARR